MSNVMIQHWKEKMSYLESIIFNEQKFVESISLLTDLHGKVHSSEITSNGEETLDDILWKNMDETCFRSLSRRENVTIAWSVYHISRIEDITMNILVGNRNQVFLEDNWNERLNCPIVDTGNSLTIEQMESLSSELNMIEIRKYRNLVGKQTNTIFHELQFSDMNRTIQKSDLQRIFDEGGVNKETQWLLEFWGSKGVAGLLYMPANFHNLHHLSESIRLKEKYYKELKDRVG